MTSVERPDTTRKRAVEAGFDAIVHRPIGNLLAHLGEEYPVKQRNDSQAVVDAAVPVVLDDYLDALTASLTKDAYYEVWGFVGEAINRLRATDKAWRERNGWSRD